jgi:hypothetical protein
MSAAEAAEAALRVRVTWRDQMLAAPKQTSWDRGFCLKPPVNGTLVVQLLNTQTPTASAACVEGERHCRGGVDSSSNSSSSNSSTADPAQSSGQCSAEQTVAAVEHVQCSCDCAAAAAGAAATAGADIVLQVSRGLHLSTYDAQSLCDTLNNPAKAAAAGTAAWLAAGFRLAWDPAQRRFAVYNISTTAASFVLRAQRSSMATQLLGFSERDHLSALNDAPLSLLYTNDDAAAVGDTAQQQQQQQQQQCERRQCVYSDELPRPCAQPRWQECVWGPPALDLLQQGGKLTVEVWGVKPTATASTTASATAESSCSDAAAAATAGADAAVSAARADSTSSTAAGTAGDSTTAVASAERAPVAAATTAAAVTTAATAAAAAVAAAAPRLAIFAPRAARERLLGRAVLNVPQLCSLATGQQLILPMLTCQRPVPTWRSRRRASATTSTLTQDWLVNSVSNASSVENDVQSSTAAATAAAAAACDCASSTSSDVVCESELAAAPQQHGQPLELSSRSTTTAAAAAAASTDRSDSQQQRQQPAVGTVLCALRLRDQSQLLVQVLQRWTLRRDEKAAAERRAAHATGIHSAVV